LGRRMTSFISRARRLAVIVPAALFLSTGAFGQQPASGPSAGPALSNQPGAAPPVSQPQPGKTESKQIPSPPVAVTDGAAPRDLPEGRGMHELSPWSMFLAADNLVKAVMIGLFVASLATWTIFLGKTVELAVSRRGLTKALVLIERTKSLAEARIAAGTRDGLLPGLIAAATDEIEISSYAAARTGIKERAESRFADLVRAETQSMRRGMGLLATIGSTAPFVGLFGTVWGIMNSFIGISKAQTTNLAVVAPGIAEALLATAIGLVAAIPAVIIYNHFSRATRNYQLLISRAAGAVGRLLSRELDRERSGKSARVAD
jgi:biopolymer transport protein ExbB